MATITRVVFIILLSLLLFTTYVLCDLAFDNKPNYKGSIKTIKTEHGDIYDCVDFYKQPAFNHPALKNHNFHPQMRPSYRPNRASTSQSYPNKAKSTIPFGLKDNACPLGTVPIRRKNDETEINSIGKNYTVNQSKPKDGITVAISRSKSPKVYHGVSANLTMHHPSVFTYEYSSGQITMKNDPDSIQVGWTVNPIYYKGDLKTRMFIYTVIGGVGCYNVDCPGFVLVRSDIPVDSVLTPFYEPRGPFSYVDFFIFQDTASSIWWLQIGHNEEQIGFWPDRIFTSLAKSGAHVECGGEVYHDPTATAGRAPMGSGFTPSRHVPTNAYCYNFVIVNEDVKVELVKDTEAYTDDLDHLYGIEDKIVPKHGGDPPNIVIEFEHIVIYGGIQNYSAINE